MARPMPALSTWFKDRVDEALSLAAAGDLAATSTIGSAMRSAWHVSRVELLYELAYLRMFTEWELYLEQTFLRYLCGYVSPVAAVRPATGAFYTTLPQAQTAVLSGRAYILWHDPDRIADRSKRFLTGCPHETVIASNRARLISLASIRHRIAHAQEDARRKFDLATMNLAGRRYRGARPGRFLRDWDTSASPSIRWLASLGAELSNMAIQIA